MSGVDYLELPQDMVVIRDGLEGWLYKEIESPKGSSVMTVGGAKELLLFLEHFDRSADRAANVLNQTVGTLRRVQLSSDEAATALRAVLHEDFLLGLILAMMARLEYKCLQGYTLPAQPTTILPWRTTGTLPEGECMIHHGRGVVGRRYRIEAQKDALEAGTFVLAGGDHSTACVLCDETIAAFERDKLNAIALREWLKTHLPPASKLVVDITVQNLGGRPAVFDEECELIIDAPKYEDEPIKLVAESWTEGGDTGRAVDRIVGAIRRVSEHLDQSIEVEPHVPREAIFAPPHKTITVSLRSRQTIRSLGVEGAYGDASLHAKVLLKPEKGGRLARKVRSEGFAFASSAASGASPPPAP